MSKTEIAQIPHIVFNFNSIQLPELASFKRTKSDRIQLPSEPSKKIKSYFNSHSFDNIENNSCSLNNSSIDSSDNCSTNENYELENKSNENYTFFNANIMEEQQQSSSPCTPKKQIIIEEEHTHTQTVQLKSDIQFSQEGYCLNYEDRNYNNIYSEDNQNVSMIVGYLCLAFAAVFFTSTLFSIFFAPLLQPTTHNLVEFLRTDNFYCFLIPLSLPILCMTIYMNWLAMKYFKHS